MVNKEPHHEACGVPAAGNQPAKRGRFRGFRICMKGLRIEALPERYDFSFLDYDPIELVNRSGHIVLQVAVFDGS
jgi:hypothetical protein